tara:strand:- start:164 stop:328 length:165 start_codon:yes stop_codon:yes gene_type:complete
MKNWINRIGSGLPSAIVVGQAYMYSKDTLYKTWYGRYDANTSIWVKLKLIKDNG